MIEVLKQMVEALEWCHGGEPVGTAEAIQAGKQLIAELESQEPVATVTSETGADITMSWWHEPALPIGTKLYTHPPQRTEPKVCCQEYDTCLEPCIPRGTHLAQRTWAGLTEEEKKNIFLKWYGKQWGYTSSIKSVMSSVEAKLKEKNA